MIIEILFTLSASHSNMNRHISINKCLRKASNSRIQMTRPKKWSLQELRNSGFKSLDSWVSEKRTEAYNRLVVSNAKTFNQRMPVLPDMFSFHLQSLIYSFGVFARCLFWNCCLQFSDYHKDGHK